MSCSLLIYSYGFPDIKTLKILFELTPAIITPSSDLASPRERDLTENQDRGLGFSLLLSKPLLTRHGHKRKKALNQLTGSLG